MTPSARERLRCRHSTARCRHAGGTPRARGEASRNPMARPPLFRRLRNALDQVRHFLACCHRAFGLRQCTRHSPSLDGFLNCRQVPHRSSRGAVPILTVNSSSPLSLAQEGNSLLTVPDFAGVVQATLCSSSIAGLASPPRQPLLIAVFLHQ
ncbi:hypothetical protein BHM03_00060781 [Ensete ventricosum]|nr:hypothetical protein BHM03_00060781 [Ensete ventricosum]